MSCPLTSPRPSAPWKRSSIRFGSLSKLPPYDDEEVTPEDEAALLEAEAAFHRGQTTPHEDILREFGIE
jgi:hypothetical protein